MSGLESLAPDSAPFFFYQRNAVTTDEARALLEFLDTVPERNDGIADPSSEFVFVGHSTEEGDLGRTEAAAGDPIWLGADWGRGVAIPSELLSLQESVGSLARDIGFERLLGFTPNLSFTSAYADR